MVDSSVTVIPGDAVHLPNVSTRLGPGIAVIRNKEGKSVPYVCKAGLLQRKGEESVWVQSQQKRYVPSEGERVIGVVTKTGRMHRVDIGGSQPAALSELAFEGATKRNKPAVQVGDMVYARLIHAHRDCDPELSCVDGSGKSSGLGLLQGRGTLLHCSLQLCRKLLSKESVVQKALGRHIKLECVVGLNGRVWITGQALMQIIVVRNCILASEYMDPQAIQEMVDEAVLL